MSAEARAWLLLEQQRWDGLADRCPHCGVHGRSTFLPTRSGRPRVTSGGTPTERRVWRCAECRQQFTVLTGTLLERTRAPLSVWLAAADAVAQGTASAAALARTHGVTGETARLLVARLVAAGVGPTDVAAPLRRVLRLSDDEVARIRAATPARRAGPTHGARADYR